MSRYNRCGECYNTACVFVTGERTDFDTSECPNFRPMTNADRIRAMSVEELAIFLGFVIQDGYCYGAKMRDELKIIPVSDHSEMMEWLKQEVLEDELL